VLLSRASNLDLIEVSPPTQLKLLKMGRDAGAEYDASQSGMPGNCWAGQVRQAACLLCLESRGGSSSLWCCRLDWPTLRGRKWVVRIPTIAIKF
jgi:hypothetical protein